MEEKYCGKCRRLKPVDCFGRDKSEPDKRARYCKACINTATRLKRQQEPGVAELNIRRAEGTKWCRGCGEDKEVTTQFWSQNRKAKDGLSTYCRACTKLYYEGGKPPLVKARQEATARQCSVCKVEKPKTDKHFYVEKIVNGRIYLLRPECRLCYAAKKRQKDHAQNPQRPLRIQRQELIWILRRRIKQLRRAEAKQVPVSMRRCCTCKVVKPLTAEHFICRRNHPSGFGPRCKPCHNAATLASYYRKKGM